MFLAGWVIVRRAFTVEVVPSCRVAGMDLLSRNRLHDTGMRPDESGNVGRGWISHSPSLPFPPRWRRGFQNIVET